nr:hypothetical protein [Tanacetum cinerariifolium]
LKLATKRSLQQTHISQASSSGANEGTETRDEESFDPIPKTPENTDNEGNGEENLGTNVGREEGHDEEEEEDELYRDVNINLGRGIQTTQEFKDSHVTLTPVNSDGQQQSSSVSSQFVTSMLNPTPDAGMESIFETTSQMDVQTPTSIAPLPMFAPTLTPSTIATITSTQQAPTPPTITPKEPMQTTFEMEDPSHPEFETGADDQPIVEPSQHPEWFSQQKKPPTPDCDWNKTLPATHGSIQPWISELA